MEKTLWIFALLLCLTVSCNLDKLPDDTTGDIIKACFTLNKNTCESSNCTVSFDATCSENAINYKWDFDDDGIYEIEGANKAFLEKTFTTPGVKTVKLLVNNAAGRTDEITHSLNVTQTTYNLVAQDWINGQTGIVLTNYTLKVRLTDQNSNPISGVLVDFNVQSGGGSLSDDATDSNGVAETTWTLGDVFDNQVVVATVNSGSIVAEQPVTFTITPTKFKDNRDGEIYQVAKIGTQTWMAENLRYAPGGLCYSNSSANCSTYGRLYSWNTMMAGAASSNNIPSGVKGVCPDGWHVPSQSEFNILIGTLGGTSIAGGKLKATTLWNSPNVGATNSSNFTALPAGVYTSSNGYTNLGQSTFIRSSTLKDANNAYALWMWNGAEGAAAETSWSIDQSFSCRCLKN